jgi:hypothetical protein
MTSAVFPHRDHDTNTNVSSAIPIDHVILAIDSLDRGVELLHIATGVTAANGGAHLGRGTQNALMSLGDGQYLELIAPNPADPSPPILGAISLEFTKYQSLTPIGWAIRAEDATAEHARLLARGLPVSELRPGSRTRADKQVLRWTTFDPWKGHSGVLPFVIAWAPETPHPSQDSPNGCTLAGIEIASPNADSLRQRFASAGWPIPIVDGPVEHLRIALTCGRGTVHFPIGG